jgi:hypothetical protein
MMQGLGDSLMELPKNDGIFCGARALLRLNGSNYFHMRMGCGSGTNTGGELPALWSPPLFANVRGLMELEFHGDSKVVVDWVNIMYMLQSIALDSWKQKIETLKSSFFDLQVNHIFREYNIVANNLSKQALNLAEGKLFIIEFDHDVKI